MKTEYYEKIAELMLFATNFRPGDKLLVSVEFDRRDVALKIAERAYERGAAYVRIEYLDKILHSYSIKGSREDFWFPQFLQTKYEECSQPGWKAIHLRTEAEADALEGLDTKRSIDYFQALNATRRTWKKAIMSGRIPWCVTYLPSELMASKAFPALDTDEALERYWQAIIAIMHLDEKDPVAFWKSKMERDVQRSRYMSSLDTDYLHFKGPGTDLKVGVVPAARWIGGFDLSQDGQQFIANIPTDEIFTSPDWRRVEGRVRLTRPFVMQYSLGPTVSNGWFEFTRGKVSAYGADKGQETLDAFFSLDERAGYLGEVALVDPQSPFAQPGIIYYNGLYDENAACHIALGQAYPPTLRVPGEHSDEQLLDMGLNVATVHEDMMIGSKEVEVSAVMRDGSKIEIINNGSFLI